MVSSSPPRKGCFGPFQMAEMDHGAKKSEAHPNHEKTSHGTILQEDSSQLSNEIPPTRDFPWNTGCFVRGFLCHDSWSNPSYVKVFIAQMVLGGVYTFQNNG